MSKDNKTSKTARVMNLLSKKNEPATPEAGEPAAPAPAAASAAPAPAAAAAPVPPIVASMAPDASLSVQIKSALEDALEGELGAQPPAPQPEPAPATVQAQTRPEPEPQPVPEPELQPEPAPQAAPVQAAAPEQPHFNEPLVPENPGYLNVMQVLVEEKAPKYVQMFGLCQCERCMADVKAYTLNHLPSKYVVIEKGDLIPRLTVYEGKFISDVTAQLLQACKVVMERPHHGR